jgi:hypothetical protein
MNERESNLDDSIVLDQATGGFRPVEDRRRRIPEPLPVKLVTVEDARLICGAGLEVQLDEFYVGLLGFERIGPEDGIVYRAENFNLRFDVLEPPVRRETLRTLGVEMLSLAAAQEQLIAREIEHTRQKGLAPGQESILLMDPAGNWIELTESRAI